MGFFFVELPDESLGDVVVEGARGFLVETDSAALARELCVSRFSGDEDWGHADIVVTQIGALSADDLDGWRFEVEIRSGGGAEGILHRVEHVVASGPKAAIIVGVSDGGTNYLLDEVLTVQGGTFQSPTRLRVIGHIGGEVSQGGIEIVDPGLYTVIPSNPVSVTGGSGSGATFDLIYDGTFMPAAMAGVVKKLNDLAAISDARFTPD